MNPRTPDLVTCVMATMPGRPDWTPSAIDCFFAQTYDQRELLIISEPGAPLSPAILAAARDPRVHWLTPGRKITPGEKLNLGTLIARGAYVANWDDDDWSAPDRIETQYRILTETGADVTALRSMLFWDVSTCQGYRFDAFDRRGGVGTSLFWRREWAMSRPFKDVTVGYDEFFMNDALARKRMTNVDDLALMVARSHPANTCKRSYQGNQWTKVDDLSVFPGAFMRDAAAGCAR